MNTNSTRKTTILFLCTGNSCRSQMAEGWARHLKKDEIEVFSAGIEKQGVNPLAVKVMAESGVDISMQRSKIIADLPVRQFDWIITLCGHANETCPILPGRKLHQGFDDPPKLVDALVGDNVDKETQLNCYRRVRDEIETFVKTIPGALEKEGDSNE